MRFVLLMSYSYLTNSVKVFKVKPTIRFLDDRFKKGHKSYKCVVTNSFGF